ncbi:MAG: hypothetical protein UT00_C0027G0004 [Parcubacteria group bacterium GW2011_GWA1_38_7]|nr:MAG: hypothetical protein UT00_C0027G0004 [Parcubacteria group bacterium GW2011_GWA1_38_7]
MGKYCWENPIFISGGSREMKIIKDKDLDWEKVNHPGSKVLKKEISQFLVKRFLNHKMLSKNTPTRPCMKFFI